MRISELTVGAVSQKAVRYYERLGLVAPDAPPGACAPATSTATTARPR